MAYLFGSEIPLLALRFRDYIRGKYRIELEIKSIRDQAGNTLTTAFLPENCAYQAEITAEKDRFLTEPFHSRYEQASWQNGDLTPRNQAPDTVFAVKQWLSAITNQGKFTLFLTALCVTIYAFQLVGAEDSIIQIMHFPVDNEQAWQLWRYFSHTLVHLSPWHLAFNLLWWWIFADAIERYCGVKKLIALYFCSAIISGVAQNIASGPAFFGLSGVVYAVLGYVFVLDKFDPQHRFNLPQGFFNVLLVGIGLGFISPLIGIQTGNTAHITGLIVGLSFGVIETKFRANG
ncbi:rhomboid family intramembrane serine protease [Caviibacterium pharyngocola]|uniref:GlpG protein n=1 Tax=Caviibacterium pharyngocola TaxID=28159 RepID=A0A2M8RXT6_9PAST|nr:rhomboid family intramembrane serine protease [Caviibacterium pharyngocola]PJG83692.1 GlpG protein [Caviibacterium pharyngocola]